MVVLRVENQNACALLKGWYLDIEDIEFFIIYIWLIPLLE